MKSMKRRLSEAQEFEIMKMILDKFLWLGFSVMAFGLYHAFYTSASFGMVWVVTGAIILILFAWIITKEYEIIR